MSFLLHFVWQGAVVAACLAYLLRLLQRSTANARYLASVTSLATMVLLPLFTLAWVSVPQTDNGAVSAVAAARIPGLVADGLAPSGSIPAVEDPPESAGFAGGHQPQPLPETAAHSIARTSERAPQRTASNASLAEPSARVFGRIITRLLPWVVSIWGLGVFLLSLRLIGSWTQAFRLKRVGVYTIGEPLQETVRRLGRQVGVGPLVTLLESTLAAVPCVVGILRPTILLPASAMTGLSPEQLESILVHELAHIRRHDNLIAAIQAVAETGLFYHPAVWWVSRQIRIERENCCDDVVVSLVESRLLYARALADMAKLVAKENQLTAAADGANLTNRIRRIMGIAPISSGQFATWWSGVLMLVLLTGLVVFVSVESSPRPALGVEAEETDAKSSTAGKDANEEKDVTEDDLAFRIFDGFGGKLALDWEVIRPDLAHVSLERNPGKLTITSQRGGLHSGEGSKVPGPLGSNFYMLPNPVGGGDFVVTTCLEGFHPNGRYQQAGPHVYDDDDNYIKALVGYGDSHVLVGSAWEDRSDFWGFDIPAYDMNLDRVWLRMTKRGRAYESAYSFDGEHYTVINEHVWGDGSPTKIGLAAMNEDGPAAPIDAVFDFFEVRGLTPEERNDPAYLERQKFCGIWETVAVADEPLHFTRFTFEGSAATIADRQRSLFSEFSVSPDREPKQFALSRAGRGVIHCVYRFDGKQLIVCMKTRPDVPAPVEFASGDGQTLFTLRRLSDIEVKAIQRNRFSGRKRFRMLDTDGDDSISLGESLADFPAPAATRQGSDLYKILDRDGSGEVSNEEFGIWPLEATVLQFDLDADGGISEREFALGEMKSATVDRVRELFRLLDKDGDGTLSKAELFFRSAEAWFVRLDRNEDDQVSYSEYGHGNPALLRSNCCRTVFDAIDTNSNGAIEREEYVNKGPKHFFHKMDGYGNGDGQVTFKESTLWKHSPKEIDEAKPEFERLDSDDNGSLTLKEYLAGLSEDADDDKVPND